MVAHILVDTGLAQVMLRGYYCARRELTCSWGSAIEVRDACLSAHGLVRKWRRVFGRMNPGLVGNEDLSEIMQNIQLDGDEEIDYEYLDSVQD